MVDEEFLDEEEDENNIINSSGYIVIFSFVSIVFLFISMILLGGFNNYVLNDLLQITISFANSGIIPASFVVTAEQSAENLILILPYLDYIWFGSFITMIISSLIFSYNRPRENYFSMFTMVVLGIILFTYVGSFIIQLTDWFRIEILEAVFPTISGITPLFSWYLDNLGVINLILICLNIVANFVDLDFAKFNKRKEDESFEEI